MTSLSRMPIDTQWPRTAEEFPARALSVGLNSLPLDDLPQELVPLLAAAAAELVQQSGIDWRMSADGLNVAFVRVIARAALEKPDAGGEHVDVAQTALNSLLSFS